MVEAWFHIYYPQNNRKSKPTLINQHHPPPQLKPGFAMSWNSFARCPDVKLQSCLVILKNRGWGCFFPIFVSGLLKQVYVYIFQMNLWKFSRWNQLQNGRKSLKTTFLQCLITMLGWVTGTTVVLNCIATW